MNKKTKNIIALTIIGLLVVGIILTIHFARVNGKNNFAFDRSTQSINAIQKSGETKERQNIPSRRDRTTKNDTTKENTNEENKSEENDTVKDGKILDDDNKPSNVTSFDKDKFNNFDSVSRNGTITTTYVILLCVESFLLGGSIMFLTMNNLYSEKEVVIVKETKSKK